MSFFHNLKLRMKLLILIGFMVLAMIGLGSYNMQITAKVAEGGGRPSSTTTCAGLNTV